MIERDYEEGGYYVACDNCSNDMQINQDDFMRAVEVMKMRGWKNILIAEASPNIRARWRHLCPNCKDKI